MRNYFRACLFLLMSLAIQVRAQDYSWGVNFENDQWTSFCISVDSIQYNNLWEIGNPQKSTFITAIEGSKSIVTDLDSSYPVNNISTFYYQLKLQKTRRYLVVISFESVVSTDSLQDYGILYFSNDKGRNWINTSDSTLNGNKFKWYKSPPAYIFTGNKLKTETYSLLCNQVDTIENLILRFDFISDSIVGIYDGWMIDNIQTDFYLVGLKEINNRFKLYPNPMSDYAFLDDPTNEISFAEIYSANGDKVLTVQSSGNYQLIIPGNALKPGFYILKIISNNKNIYYQKLIKN